MELELELAEPSLKNLLPMDIMPSWQEELDEDGLNKLISDIEKSGGKLLAHYLM